MGIKKEIKKDPKKVRKFDLNEWSVHTGERLDLCPETPRQLPVAIVADCNYVQRMGSAEAARQQLLEEVRLASNAFLEAFNVSIALTSILLFEECDGEGEWEERDCFNIPCKNYPGLDAVLNRFSRWRDHGLGDEEMPSAAIVHLVTSCDYSERIGISWVNQVCRTQSFTDSMGDTISGTSLSVAVFPKGQKTGLPTKHWAMMAHGMAHNLGAVHDCVGGETADCCLAKDSSTEETHIMSPVLGAKIRAQADLKVAEAPARSPEEPKPRKQVPKDREQSEPTGAASQDKPNGEEKSSATTSKGESSKQANRLTDKVLLTGKPASMLMGASTTPEQLTFSACTVQDVCGKLSYIGSCLVEEGGFLRQSHFVGLSKMNGLRRGEAEARSSRQKMPNLIAVCGNGIKEGDEECDCGDECEDDKCCGPDCKLRAGSSCSDKNDPCCRSCQLIAESENYVCNGSSTEGASSSCRLESYCNGESASCPLAPQKPDGTPCGKTRLVNDLTGICSSGVCTSRDEQCAVFGRHMHLTSSCPYTRRSCSIICQGQSECVDLRANYVDGTKCGHSGSCSSGMCSEFGSSASSIHNTFSLKICVLLVVAAFICQFF